MSYHNKWKIEHRIACPEAGYHATEARFASIEEYILYLFRLPHFHPDMVSEDELKEALNRFRTEEFNAGYDRAVEMDLKIRGIDP